MKIFKEDIKDITLLSLEHFNDNKTLIPAIQAWWWLRTKGAYSNKAAYVFIDGDAYAAGYDVNKDRADVRPLFYINPQIAEKLKPGEKVEIGKYTATVMIDRACLLDDCVCKHRFDEKSGSYESSEIKQFLESEEFIGMIF